MLYSKFGKYFKDSKKLKNPVPYQDYLKTQTDAFLLLSDEWDNIVYIVKKTVPKDFVLEKFISLKNDLWDAEYVGLGNWLWLNDYVDIPVKKNNMERKFIPFQKLN
jgi:hypothetical protein